jgi:hypothetical protein
MFEKTLIARGTNPHVALTDSLREICVNQLCIVIGKVLA